MAAGIREKYFGPKEFYQRTAKIAVPLALQQLLSSAMSIADTLMVSWIGQVTAVGTAAQIDTLSSMIAYGMIGGIGIFSAQFYGAKDEHNLKRCFGLSLVLSMANAVFWVLMATFFGRAILGFYMNDAAIVDSGMAYLSVSKYSLIFGALTFCFSYMYRSIHKAALALNVSIMAMVLNILFNWLLIFGVGPFPKMGVIGAALGTVLAQGIAAAFLIIHAYATRQPFVGKLSEMFQLTAGFVKPIILKILPLIFNETTFGFGLTLFVKAFGQLGKSQMDAYYVGNQICNVFLFAVYGYGNAVQVLLGTLLGQGKIEQAKQECRYHLGLSFIIALILVVAMVVFARPLVDLFALQDPAVVALAVRIVYVFAVKISMRLYNFIIFSILKSGGDSKIIQFLDSGMEWMVGLPTAFACVSLFHLQDMAVVLLITQLEQLVRLFFGMVRVHKNYWAKDITVLVH
jgi:putative MATE family efflux protein